MAMDTITDTIAMMNKFGDKLEEFVSIEDEAIKSTVQSLGLITTKFYGDKTKADKIATNIINASNTLVQDIGLPFSNDNIAEFQKAYADISNTALAFNETDYVTLAEVQKTLELSAQESAEFTNLFITMGSNVTDVSDFFVSLIETSTKAGVSSKHIIKDMKDYFDSSRAFKLGNNLQDMARLMSYAKRIKVDIGGMLDLMNSVSEPEAAVDLGAQLQALDTVFLGLDPIDLMNAAMGDAEQFTNMIMGPIRDNINKFYDVRTGQMTQYGKMFSTGLLKIKGIDKVFKSEVDFSEFLMKAGKEDVIKSAISNTLDLYSNFITLTPEEQNNIIGALAARYQGDGTITGLNGKKLGSLTADDMRMIMNSDLGAGANEAKIAEAAKGAVSIKDQVEANKLLVASISNTTKTINAVNTGLMSKELRTVLQVAGNTIMDLGLEQFMNPYFKQIEALTDYLGLSTEEATMFGGLLTENSQALSAAIKGIYVNLWRLDPSAWFTGSGALLNQTDFNPDVTYQSSGGLIDTKSVEIPKKSLQSSSKFISAGSGSSQLSDLLSSFITNKFGPGIISPIGIAGTTKIIVSGEIRNIINEKDAGAISGDKVLKILENQMKKTLGKQPITNPEKYLQNR